ncbi:hypothetical protein, partial [Bacillus massiliigorillae]|uniref:hypothetical protein n=1 Tax=Bacillus massiliigorillae TaxID=1243664 RepID=UPI0005AA8397
MYQQPNMYNHTFDNNDINNSYNHYEYDRLPPPIPSSILPMPGGAPSMPSGSGFPPFGPGTGPSMPGGGGFPPSGPGGGPSMPG